MCIGYIPIIMEIDLGISVVVHTDKNFVSAALRCILLLYSTDN